MRIGDFLKRCNEFAATSRGKRLIGVLRTVFLVVVGGVLIYQLSKTGWNVLLRSLPAQPLFYVLVAAMYFLLPAWESVIYGRFWSMRPLHCLGVMLRKRVLNVDVLGYSGEVYLFTWAKSRVARAPRVIMGVIKDNLIVTSVSSSLAAALLITGMLLSGQITPDQFAGVPNLLYVAPAALVVILIGLVVYRFRHVIFSLSRRVLAWLTVAHVSRFMIGYVFQILAWWVVVPEAPFETWAILLVVHVVINRISFLPSSDLVFVTAGTSIAPLLEAPTGPLVGMLLTRSVMDRVLNLIFFLSSVWWERKRPSNDMQAVENLDVPDGPLGEEAAGETRHGP